MHIYTSCAGCGGSLPYVGERRNTTHPGCHDPEQRVWQLEDDFLAAAEAEDDERADRLAEQLDALGTRPPRLLDAALLYAQWGWPVFPLRPGTKEPATRHGFKEATTDEDTIRHWWRRTSRANVGIPTGGLFDVLDVDLKHGVWREWLALQQTMPDAHGIAITASGGLHVLLEPTGVGNNANLGKLRGFDFRGRGGYIVVAPSVLGDGSKYTWWVKPSPAVKNVTVRRAA